MSIQLMQFRYVKRGAYCSYLMKWLLLARSLFTEFQTLSLLQIQTLTLLQIPNEPLFLRTYILLQHTFKRNNMDKGMSFYPAFSLDLQKKRAWLLFTCHCHDIIFFPSTSISFYIFYLYHPHIYLYQESWSFSIPII